LGLIWSGGTRARSDEFASASSQPLGDIDRTILEALQRNGHLSHAELDRMVGLAASSVNERIRKLVELVWSSWYSAA